MKLGWLASLPLKPALHCRKNLDPIFGEAEGSNPSVKTDLSSNLNGERAPLIPWYKGMRELEGHPAASRVGEALLPTTYMLRREHSF